MRETPAPRLNGTTTRAEPVSFLAAAAALAAIDAAVRTAQSPAPAETTGYATEGGPEPALAALMLLREVRTELAGWEAGLVENARAAGATWADLAQPMGVASRQAAENRYLRLRPTRSTTAEPAPTGAERVKAVRDRRAADRTVTAWARTSAADLRVLAAQLAALTDLTAEALPAQSAVRTALAAADAADLLTPLAGMRPHLGADHPDLAARLDDLTRHTDQIRHDSNRRRA
ncbi:HSP18 transcriptional regulator [Kitasatospora sp. HPMI-4]|uniref:HSP18 transcriptional regulator n=1 Tax=Kitasatospora sp. HPMI-4 TaxID=3448443 RepID=UPI003F1BCD9E